MRRSTLTEVYLPCWLRQKFGSIATLIRLVLNRTFYPLSKSTFYSMGCVQNLPRISQQIYGSPSRQFHLDKFLHLSYVYQGYIWMSSDHFYIVT